uniref:Uncharacterized protein n=1 Tax=Mycena chlorophos TaxID=658473 RepID=A0ABQ0L1A1_MYCCL|nr:predicted protein [Mycena chlorophos]
MRLALDLHLQWLRDAANVKSALKTSQNTLAQHQDALSTSPCSVSCYKKHKEGSCRASSANPVAGSSSLQTRTEDDDELPPTQEPPLRPLTSLKWPYVPDQSSYPDPLKRDDPKTLQTHQYEAIATSAAVREVLAAHPLLPALLTQIDQLRGHERDDVLQRALGVSSIDISARSGQMSLGDDVTALRALAEAVEGAVRGGKEGVLGLDWE